MAEKSYFFNDVNDDRIYLAEDFAMFFSTIIANGVFLKPSNNLQVLKNEETPMAITIKPGKAWINGYMYWNTGDLVKILEPAYANPRIDRVVARWVLNTRDIKVYVLTGTPATVPVAPELTRNNNIYEIAIADILVGSGITSITQSNITDTRLDTDLCGIVHALIDQLDSSTLFIQFQDAFTSWFNSVKEILDDDVVTNLLNLINNNTSDITVHTTAIANHTADNAMHSRSGTTTGSANVYALTLSPAPTALVDNFCVAVKINVANTGSSTLNVNGLGAKPIIDSRGNAVLSGSLISGNIYTLRYNGVAFIIQGDHPISHSPSMIIQDLNNRFVSDTEKTTWNGKIDKSVLTAAGDIIYATAAATPAKLAKGTDGKILTLASGLPIWEYGLWTKISETTLSAESALINLTVPTGFKQLKLIMVVAHTGSSGNYDITINFNDDSTAGNYRWFSEFRNDRTYIQAENDGSAAITNKIPIMFGATPGYSVPFSFHEVDITNISGKYKDVKNEGGSPVYTCLSRLVGAWRNNTNEISKISIGITGYAYITGSRFLLLGMR